MITAQEIKEYAATVGAQRCGIASVDRFDAAPEGFRPQDVFNNAKSVVVCLRQMPGANILARNPVPYTHTAYKMYEEMDRISMELCRFFQQKDVMAVLVPADVPYLHWDEANKYGHGILSLKHAAAHAGLGIMGRSTIFIDREYGNMVYIGAVLIDAQVEPDPLAADMACPAGCERCLKSCSVSAMDGVTVNQKLCRGNSFVKCGRGWDLYSCSRCRVACPHRLGYQAQ